VVVHGLLALGLVYGGADSLPVSLGRPGVALPPAELLWFDDVGRTPRTDASAISTSKKLPLARPAAPPAEPRREPRRHGTRASSSLVQARAPSVAAAQGASPAETAAHDSQQGAPGVESAAPASGVEGSPSPVGGMEARSAAPGNGEAGRGALGDLRDYARRLGAAVARQRHYPASAARLGMEGTAYIQLRIRHDGLLMEPPRLVRSSGQEVLDAEALRMVEAAAPFEPMPGSAARPDAAFVIPVGFSLRSGD
jgi:TonB family protein